MYKIVLLLNVLIMTLAACTIGGGQAADPASLAITGTEEVAAVTPATLSVPAADETEALSGEVVTSQEGDGLSGVVAYSFVPEASTVTYEVGETFLDQGNVFQVAVGTTQGVTGEILVNFDQPQEALVGTLAVDISGFTSDNNRRDSAIRDRFLQSAQYPMVTFTLKAIEGLPEAIEQGVEYPITLQGDLTIRGTTRPAAFDVQVRLDGNTLTGQAVTTFLMSDYGFGPINVLGILQTEDEVKITVDFVARP